MQTMRSDEELFTTRVRKATRKIHSVSDALVNAKFAISLRDETVWGGGLFVFYHVFAYLEDAHEKLNMPELNKLYAHPILFRKKAFEEDLNHYLGENWRSLPKSSELEVYIDHLNGLVEHCPLMLTAFIYHLYLGLLSGGQILSKKRKMFWKGAPTKDAYVDKVTDFTGVDIPQLKILMYTAMNEMAMTQNEEWRKAFIEESSTVFLLNNSVVNSIGGQDQVLKNLFYKTSAVVLLVVAVVMAYKVHK